VRVALEAAFIFASVWLLKQFPFHGFLCLLSDSSLTISSASLIGPGPAGLELEAYYAGWLVIGDWHAHGMTFADIARIPRSRD